ncbi:MAG: S9 family peptidase [Dysgonamonadaceae bacterium]|jgi:dipeptidyl aminopeptidase/acylaminoacyl peptidase|nr:S9 family peptidase [Dysgonamonadaceae bacterium]
MKRFRLLAFIAVLITTIGCGAFAQSEIRVEKIKASPLIPVFTPVLIDSTNVEKKAFEQKELLKTIVNFEESFRNKVVLIADTAGVFAMSSVTDTSLSSRNKAIQLLSFNIDADRYCQANLSVTSTDMLEIYVNNKLEKTKETKEDSLSKAKIITVDLTLEPRQYKIFIKRLTGAKNTDEPVLKISVSPSKKDSLAQLTVSTDALRKTTIHDMLEGSRLSSNSNISSSGNYFLSGIINTFPGGKGNTSIDLRETQTNKIIYRFPSDVNPRWVYGKDQLAYSKTGVSNKDIYLLDLATAEEKKMAENIKFDSYHFSPDSRFLIILVREEIPADKGDLKRVLSPADRAGSYRGRNSVYLYDLETQTEQRITFGRTNTFINDIRFDSKKALFAVSEENITERPFSKRTLYELDLITLAVDTLFSDPFINDAQYSPDGTQLLIRGSGEAFSGIGLNIKAGQISNTYDYQSFIVDLKTKDVRPITKDFDPSITDAYWSIYDKQIYFTAQDKDRVQIYVYNTQTGTFKKLNLAEDMIRGFNPADKTPVAIYQGEGPSNGYRMYRYDLKTAKSTLLADPLKKQVDELALSQVTDWNFTAADGTSIEGRYYLPYGFDPAKKYPLIVYYYGGTSPTSRTFESSYPLQVYAALGYVVYTLQPSGTVGFGQEFAARHVNAWGEKTAEEIILGTQLFCKEHDFVDSRKIGCIGASYGGFMTQFLQTKTDIFAAAVSHAGISNITSYWGEGYWGYSYSGAASANSYPWNNPQLYTQQSPLFHADKIQTPLLLLHGTVDTNVPIGESIQMFNALRILGKTVEFITVDGENHGISVYQKRIDWNKTIYAWFAKWLKDQPEWWNALYPEK